jgi:predicted nicotinamide N-methyase
VGLQLWSGSLVLAEFVLAHRDLFRGCVAVELGGGLGLVSIVLAMPLKWTDSASGSAGSSAVQHVTRPQSKSDGEMIAAAVFCTDYAFGDVLSNCLRNCERNVGDRVRVREFDFLSSESDCTLLKLLTSKSHAASWLPTDKDAKSSVSWRQSDASLLSASSAEERKASAPLLLFAADVVYDDDLTEALVGKLKLLLAPAGPFKVNHPPACLPACAAALMSVVGLVGVGCRGAVVVCVR